MKRSARLGKMVVTADAEGVVSHAGSELLRELAGFTGLIHAWDRALIGTYKAPPIHWPGNVLADLAVAIADGGDCISDIRGLRDRGELFGPVASIATTWRVLDRVSAARLGALRHARAVAREKAWKAGAAPDLSTELFFDMDASIVIAHSDKEDAEPTWKKTYGFHPLFCFLDRPDISSGEALAGMLRPGNAGSNTTSDHIAVLDMAIANVPQDARPHEGPDSVKITVRCDSAGATYGFAAHCRENHVGFSLGFAITEAVRDAISWLGKRSWMPAVEEDGSRREGAWVAEVTRHLDLTKWPTGARVIVRKERPHPGAQLSLFDDTEGFRFTALIVGAKSPAEHLDGTIAQLELTHRSHARIEDRIRQAKAAGLRNLPCKETAENAAWLECVLAAADLVAWSKLLCFSDDPQLAHCEIGTFRYRILHIAARITRSARKVFLRLDRTWSWAKQLAIGFARLRAAFA